MEKEEYLLKFPSMCVPFLSKSTAKIAEFNRSGTLLAVGCKMGIILIMDLLTSRIVKWLSLFSDLEIADWIFHGFEDFEELDIVYLLKTLKTSKMQSNVINQGVKPKLANIRLKDYMINIESLQFSLDSRKLLVVYTDKDRTHSKFTSSNKDNNPETKTKDNIISKIIEWDIIEGQILNEFDHEYRITDANYLPYRANTIVCSGAIPFYLNNFETQTYFVDVEKYQDYMEKSNTKSENWIIKIIESKKKQSFAIFNKDFNVLAVLEGKENTIPSEEEESSDSSKLKYEEIIEIINSKDPVDIDNEMDTSTHEEAYKKFVSLLTPDFKVTAKACLSWEITSLSVYQPNPILIANCSDKSLRLYDISDESLHYESLRTDLAEDRELEQEETKLVPFRSFTDIILKRKFTGGMLYRAKNDKDLYLLTGVEKAGELIAYSTKTGNHYLV